MTGTREHGGPDAAAGTTDQAAGSAAGEPRPGKPGAGGEGGAPRPRAGKPGPGTGEVPVLTAEGWYSMHQLFTVDRTAARAVPAARRSEVADGAAAALAAELRQDGEDGGWSVPVRLIGSRADVMLVHFRRTLDDLGDVQRRLAREPLFDLLRPTYSFLSVTEAGLYQLAADLAREAVARGGEVGDPWYQAELAERLASERENPHVRRRLYPERPAGMDYVCFYPMSKRRDPGQNWYALSIAERNRLMWAHGLTGRRYAGRVSQVVSGAVGLDAWEWGVTLFAADPLEFKRIVTEMRFDEVSARYAEFGAFYVGRTAEPAAWVGDVLG